MPRILPPLPPAPHGAATWGMAAAPARKHPGRATKPPAPAGTTPAGGALRVLYVDDNAINTMLMAAMFERLPGLDLRCTASPHQCLAMAVADPPALLLVDIQMPVMDGYQLLQQLRAHPATRLVPAIAVSANAMPQDLARGQAAGFADYLTKPLDMQRLQQALQAVLPGWVAPPPG